jgi:acyl-coenzyme A synthetase/AMP-(fatty) acid ligase
LGLLGCAFIKLFEGAALDKKRILEHCRQNLAPYKVPRQVHFVDELPKTITKKIRKLELKRQVIEKQKGKQNQREERKRLPVTSGDF